MGAGRTETRRRRIGESSHLSVPLDLWATETKGAKGVKLVLQDDRNVVLYAGDGPAWSSKTDTTEPPAPAPEAEAATPEVAPVAEEAPAPAPEAEPAPPPPPAPRTYTVVSGDTLSAISERFLR
ncbi:MAG: hypothetical protein QOF66_7532 [Mycobacterium sp.]|jgi:nucleoid-associated protein YgaU|nr:hypothetical protein [Mycobacterium sp.]